MTNVEKQILENQEAILLALNKLLTPHCKGSINDSNNETQTNIKLINRYHSTRIFLGQDPYE